jgi:hypothetical protein
MLECDQMGDTFVLCLTIDVTVMFGSLCAQFPAKEDIVDIDIFQCDFEDISAKMRGVFTIGTGSDVSYHGKPVCQEQLDEIVE